MGDFLLMVLTVFTVGVGGYLLGRLQMRDRVDVLLDELDAANDLLSDFMRVSDHPSGKRLRLVRDETP
jgi:hypothetical protein